MTVNEAIKLLAYGSADEYADPWYGRDYLELMVTAWMPLPEPYKESEE